MTEKKRTTTGGISQLLKMSPMAQILAGGPVKLPDAKAPSLENLEVTVPALPDLTEEELMVRFAEKARAQATVKPRAPGEQLAMGDEVRVDTIGYADGKIIPFSARFNQWMTLEPMVMLKGYSETIAQGKVGDSIMIDVLMPDDYPIENLRGKTARFIVDVLEAKAVTLPDMESTAFLKKANLGATVEEAIDLIQDELEEEMVGELWNEAREMVLDVVAERSDARIPEKLVDEEIRRRWGQAEGTKLVEKNFDVDEQQEALDAWLKDPVTRADCERRLRIGLALKAMAEDQKLELTPDKVEALVTKQASLFGLTAADVRKALGENENTTKQMVEMAWYLLAVEHVMSKAKVHFEGAQA